MRFIAIIFTILVALSTSAAELSTLTKEGDFPAIYKVGTKTARGYGGGTAFLVKHPTSGKIVAVTNRHVCDVPSLTGIFELVKESSQSLAKIERKSKRADLCLLTIKEGFSPEGKLVVLPLAKKNPIISSDVTAVGYAMLQTFMKYSGSFEGIEAQPEDPTDPYMSGRDTGITSFPIFHGNSGSPLLNPNGEVVGVMYAYTGNAKGLFVPLKALLYFLTNNEG